MERLGAHLTGPKSPQATVIYSDGKAKSPSLKYSLTYSVVAELGNGISAKLLLQTEASSETVNLATESFLDFLQAFHDGSLEPGVVVGMEKAQPVGGMLLFAFNPQTGKLEVVDPVPKHVRDKQTQA